MKHDCNKVNFFSQLFVSVEVDGYVGKAFSVLIINVVDENDNVPFFEQVRSFLNKII